MPRQPLPPDVIEIAQRTLDAAFEVHTEIGPGCLETVYELAMLRVLSDEGLHVERQKAIPFHFRGEPIRVAFRADLLVEERVLVELKVARELAPIHHAQTRTYLKLARKPVALLLNFGALRLRDGYDRIVHDDFVYLPPSRALPKPSGPRAPSGPRE